MKKMLAMALVLMLTLTAAACAETFKMGFDAEYPPYTYMGDDGEYTGFDIEMCKKVCEKLGWELELVPINWDTKLMTLDMGEIDCIWSGLTIDVIDPEAYCLSTPYSDNSQMILTRADSGITTLSDLAGKKVAVQLGTSADLLLQGDQKALADTFDGGVAVKLPNYNDCFAQLEAGAVDAIKIAVYGDEYVMLDESIASEKYGICFRAEDTEMCKQVEDAYMELVQDGTYQALAEEFGLDVSALCLLETEGE